MKPPLTDADYENAATRLRCEVAAIKAVAEVESGPYGAFLPSGEPTILYERHIFHRLTGGKFDAAHPDISNKEQGGYGPESVQHAKLQKAVALDRNAALQSCSWGRFQILGLNWISLHYSSLQEFINAMYRSEADQLEAFLRFVEVNGLKGALQLKNWKAFARRFNGPKYFEHNYDGRIADAYRKFSGV